MEVTERLLEGLKDTLIEKLNEWGHYSENAEMLEDTFSALLEVLGVSTDQEIWILEQAMEYFKHGGGRDLKIYDVLKYSCTAIKVNNGY